MLGTVVGAKDARATFLERKTQEQVQLLEKVPELERQDGLLLLWRCIQVNLRHLLRSLKTDDINNAWKDLDNALHHCVRRLRGDGHYTTEHDTILSSIPTRMGGCGIPRYTDLAQHAKAAMECDSNIFLEHTLNIPTPLTITREDDETPGEIPGDQRYRCQKMFQGMRDEMMARLDEDQAAAVVENASYLGRQWLDTLPLDSSTELSGATIQCGLHVRTLSIGKRCGRCAEMPKLGHEQTCSTMQSQRTGRHEQINFTLLRFLKRVKGGQAIAEPLAIGRRNALGAIEYTDNSRLRGDLRVVGPAALDGQASEFDVTVTSIHTHEGARQQRTAATRRVRMEQGRWQAAAEGIRQTLEGKAQIKRRQYENILANDFYPLAFSAGGVQHATGRAVLQALE